MTGGSSIPFLDTREFNREVLLEKSHPCSVYLYYYTRKKKMKKHVNQSMYLIFFLSFPFSLFLICKAKKPLELVSLFAEYKNIYIHERISSMLF